jgi:NAD(P)-dependent dehydrogenase (short-subunit alcohol dehydrogenase family)
VLREYQRLAAAVPAALEPGSLPFLQVTIGGERVIGDEAVSPPASAVGGLPRVLAQEVPAVRWRTLDLPADADGAAAARGVLTEIADLTAGARELAVRGTRRWIRHWQPWHPPLDDALAGNDGEPVVVVLGGLGRVGLALAERLCAAGRPRLVLASRSGLPTEDIAAGNPVLTRRLDVVRRLRAAGHQVRVAAVDAADAAAVGDLLASVAAEHGRIDLVVYAPVTVELTPFAEWDDSTVDAVLTPKVTGALALRDAVGGLPATARPSSVVLMASAAGSIGGFGLSAYVAGSRFLDGLAASLDGEQAGTRWLAADWDRWRFGTDDERESVAEITMRHALDAADALTALLRLTGLAAAGQAPAQVAVSPGELNSRSATLGGRTVRAAGPAAGTLPRRARRHGAAA